MDQHSEKKGSTNLAFSDLVAQWHPGKNSGVLPSDVKPNSHKKAWWMCSQGHEWEAAVYSRTQGSGCPVCAGRKPGEDNVLSVVRPELAKQWHPSKNGDLLPSDVTVGSRKKVWWKGECGHEWVTLVCYRTAGTGCPFCHGKAVGSDNSLATLFPGLSQEWHPKKNGEMTPDCVTAGSSKKVWWICKNGHTWVATVSSRKKGAGCPHCSKKKSSKLDRSEKPQKVR